MRSLNPFFRGYIDASLWSSTDERGRSLDKDYDLTFAALETMQADCDRFQQENEADLVASGLSDEKAGECFWLSRNRHGTGFWDRGLDDVLAIRLHAAAKAFGECDLIANDDGSIDVM